MLEHALGGGFQLLEALFILEMREQSLRREAPPGVLPPIDFNSVHPPSELIQSELVVHLTEIERGTGAESCYFLQLDIAVIEVTQEIVLALFQALRKRLPRYAKDVRLIGTRGE
ncbi:MAG: hypothetical protein ACLFUX_07535 [Spirochaetaceae bacterium]